MPVTAKIRLQVISEAEMREAERQLTKLEDIANRTDTAKAKIDEKKQKVSVARLRETRQKKVSAVKQTGEAPIKTQKRPEGPIFQKPPETQEQPEQKKKGTNIPEQAPKTKTLPAKFKPKDITSATAIEKEPSDYEKQKNNIKDLQNKVSDINSKLSKTRILSQALENPTASMASLLLGMSAKIPIAGAAIAGSAEMAQLMYSLYISEYGPGGTKDTTKLVTDATLSYLGTENDEMIFGGNQLFLGDPTTHKGVLDTTSNTQNLKNGMRRYNLITNGYWRNVN